MTPRERAEDIRFLYANLRTTHPDRTPAWRSQLLQDVIEQHCREAAEAAAAARGRIDEGYRQDRQILDWLSKPGQVKARFADAIEMLGCDPEAGFRAACRRAMGKKSTKRSKKEMNFTIEQIAKVCHEANTAYCNSIGDNSQTSWEQAAEWQRQSAINGVEYSLANQNAPASAQHEAWLQDKAADGWKYGPVKDPTKKEHPCFVPYDELPVEQRMKDYLFKAVVAAFARCGATELAHK